MLESSRLKAGRSNSSSGATDSREPDHAITRLVSSTSDLLCVPHYYRHQLRQGSNHSTFHSGLISAQHLARVTPEMTQTEPRGQAYADGGSGPLLEGPQGSKGAVEPRKE